MNIDKGKTVGALAAELPGAVRLFERLQIDYCCGGKRSLAEVCQEKNLGVDEVVAALQTIGEVQRPGVDEKNWATSSLSELARYIVENHHSFVRREIPRISALLNKVCEVHGGNRPEFPAARAVWTELAEELQGHMDKEEMILFPFVERLEAGVAGSGAAPAAPFGSVRNPIRAMVHEHDAAGRLVGQINVLLTDRSGCNTCLELFRSLDGFEKDLHQHIHLENNILFPRAEELENLVSR